MMTIVTAMMLLVMIRLMTISMPMLMVVKNEKLERFKKVPKPPGQVFLSVLSLPFCGQELKRFPAVRSSHQHDNRDNHNRHQNNYHHHNCHHGLT